MADTNTDITTVNSLIATTLDSADGYTQAAEDSASGSFASIFRERSTERRQVVTMLQNAVREMGGNPEDDGTVLASAHRTFLDLKSAVTGKDDTAIIAEVERGEDYLKDKYETAMADGGLSQQARSTVQQAFDSVKRGHDQMRDLKNSMARS